MGASVLRWKLEDPATGDTYTFPYNPREMGSLFPERAITVASTLYQGALVYEGTRPPQQWSFSGSVRDQDHHEALRTWTYERSGRLVLTDHYGRRISLLLLSFAPTPKRSVGVYWRHEYEVKALVFDVGTPTVVSN